MSVGVFCGVAPFLSRKKSFGNQGKGRSDGNRNPFRSKKFRKMKAAMVRRSREASGNGVTMAELKNKIITFRDLLDLPPCVGSASMNELLILTLKDITKIYPNLKLGAPTLEVKDASMHKSLRLFCDALKSLGDLWMTDKGMNKCKYDPSKKLGRKELERIALRLLDDMIKLARERFFEVTDEEEEMRHYSHSTRSFGKGESGSYSDGAKSPHPSSPVTPTSVLPGPWKPQGKCHPPPLLKPQQNDQATRNLSSIDLKRLSFHLLPHAISVDQETKHSAKLNNMEGELERKEKAEVKRDDAANKVNEDDDMVDCMEMSDGVNGESEVKSDASKIGRNDLAGKVREDDAMVDYMEMSNEVGEVEVKYEALKIGRSDSVGKISDDNGMVDMDISNEVNREAEVKSDSLKIGRSDSVGKVYDEGRNWIESCNVKPIVVPVTSPKQEEPAPVPPSLLPELPSNVTEQSVSEPVCEVSMPLLITPQPPSTVTTPGLTEQDQPLQFPLYTSSPLPSPLPPPVVPRNFSGPPPPPPPPSGTSCNAACAPPPPPPPIAVGGSAPLLAPPMSATNGSAPPPPPPMGGSKGPVPSPPMLNGCGPPPPPGAGSLRLKQAATKLKRSSQMGNLYRRLKGKVEGTSSAGKSSGGQKGGKVGAPAGGQQGMADALLEMTKKSAYFLQIEEDVKNYLGIVKELKIAVSAFQTSDMTELVKFHRHVESHLEKLTDESQVLSRCEDFPCKKLEALRMSAALYTKLDTIANTLRDWPVGLTLAQQLDKSENYFNKIKVELDALERTKDEELKRFQAQKINFDFSILLRIKELMVDLSSNCIELALKEKREAESKQNGQPKQEGKNNDALRKLMWRAFQFAFKVYSFAGGQDDRADQLTKELAEAIEDGY